MALIALRSELLAHDARMLREQLQTAAEGIAVFPHLCELPMEAFVFNVLSQELAL